jgi:hypothetical protein
MYIVANYHQNWDDISILGAQMDLGMATKPLGGPTWFEIGILNYDMLMMNIGYLF